MKTSTEIRTTFLDFFRERGHRVVKSSSLVPGDDPTLLFTNAGMNQFKDVFLGLEQRDYKRATTCQKCMRVSGKHNDLDTVGRTPLHHTFFEMLGNFSFGDYFKREAVRFAWDLCTEVYGLAPRRLIASVYEDDDEAYGLWRDFIGVPQERIYRLGAEENFWAMGDTGPCGPCAELHYDLEDSSLCQQQDCEFGCECGRYVEIWNLVFMQFNRDSRGRKTPLPSPSIDTGMGLERITAILQGVTSNYDTDLFRPLIREAERLTATSYGDDQQTDVSLRILADHSRACAVLIGDGVIPDNEGRGYVLRKILRRATRHGQLLGKEEPFLFTLATLAADLMSEPYPDLEPQREYLARVVRYEEEKFRATLNHGMGLFEEIVDRVRGSDGRTLPGKDLFRLYDTYGFPVDLARDLAQERSLEVDEPGFFAEMEKQRQRARASWKGAGKTLQPVHQELAGKGYETEFTGYEQLDAVPGSVLALVGNQQLVPRLGPGEEGEVVLDRSPFYAEAGGQVGDQGTLETDAAQFRILDTYAPAQGLRLSRVRVQQGELKPGDAVRSSVDLPRRQATARNHTSTHLMHAALRRILGVHVKQAGSLVSPDRLRFDFTHFRSVTPEELSQVEDLVNREIRRDSGVDTRVRSLDQALEEGATALFGEKYDSQVRVVSIPDFSMELCGGTHVGRTGEIGLFKITSEGSVSAGVRRIEALTGEAAMSRYSRMDAIVSSLSRRLKTPMTDLEEAIRKSLEDLKQAQKQVDALQLKVAGQKSLDTLDRSRRVRGIRVVAEEVADLDRSSLRQLADQLKNRLQSGVVVLGTPIDGKVSLVAMVSDDLTDRIQAHQLIRKLARLVGGGGGGRPDMAEAGGRDVSRLGEALEQTYRLVEESLN